MAHRRNIKSVLGTHGGRHHLRPLIRHDTDARRNTGIVLTEPAHEPECAINTSGPKTHPIVPHNEFSIDISISIVQLGRKINSMLQKHFSPSDVFEQTTLATNYAVRLLSYFPASERRPESPPFVRRKVPRDVYRRLLALFADLKKISQAS